MTYSYVRDLPTPPSSLLLSITSTSIETSYSIPLISYFLMTIVCASQFYFIWFRFVFLLSFQFQFFPFRFPHAYTTHPRENASLPGKLPLPLTTLITIKLSSLLLKHHAFTSIHLYPHHLPRIHSPRSKFQ